MPLGVVIFLWIFLLPFIAIGLILIGTCLTAFLGRCEVRLRGPKGVIFTGFARLGWKRRFDASAVRAVRIGKTTWQENDEHKPCIVIDAEKKHRLATNLPDERREWLAAVLHQLLVTPARHPS